MTINWKLVKNFGQEEFDDPEHPGSGGLINPEFLVLIVRLRADTKWPMVIHAALDVHGTHGHAENSYHLLKMGAKAADFHFETEASQREQVYYVLHGGFSGVGVYYDWTHFGFHIDMRPKDRTQIWTRENGKYMYFLK